MVNYLGLDYVQLKELEWFVNVMKLSKSMREYVLQSNEIDGYDAVLIEEVLSYCKNHVERVMYHINDNIFTGLDVNEEGIKSKLSKLYRDWDIISINNGRALYHIIEEFYDRYNGIYSHVKKDDQGVMYDVVEEHYALEVFLYEQGIGVYREQDIYGNELSEYSCNENFYRLRIKDADLYELYKLGKNNDEIMKFLKYYIQKLVYVMSPYGLIIGVNMYDGIDYIDVLISSGYYNFFHNNEVSYLNNYNIEHAVEVVQSYVLKELIHKIV